MITTLETLKTEAAEVERNSAETDIVMAEVEQTSQLHRPLLLAGSAFYFTMEQLNQVRLPCHASVSTGFDSKMFYSRF